MLTKVSSQVDSDPNFLSHSTSPPVIIALCTGLLPAAVLVASKDTSQVRYSLDHRMKIVYSGLSLIISSADLSGA